MSPMCPPWNIESVMAISEAVPELGDSCSEDAKMLFALLSFLSRSDKIPSNLLSRGAAPRKRWSEQGEVEDYDATHVGLAPEFYGLLSDIPRLNNALDKLGHSSAILRNTDQTYTLNEAVAGRIHECLSTEQISFLKLQALIVAYRAIPWKYIEPAVIHMDLFLLHLKYTLEACHDSPACFPVSTKADLALTLIEASRFPGMAWKRFAISQAEMVASGLQSRYIDSCIAQSQCILNRISGKMDQAVDRLGDLSQDHVSGATDKRMHSVAGQGIIQKCLNCVQVEDFSTAKTLLDSWSPLDQDPSSIESVVIFRKDTILGRILRFQGAFEESLAHLKRSHTKTQQHKTLFFDDDLRDLTCDLADTLRELDDPVSAENHLRVEITRREQSHISLGKSLLELTLAEALFAQGRLSEAKNLCVEIQLRPDLLRMEKLRLHITMAKIHHLESDFWGSLSCWSNAMKEIEKYHLSSGRTTRIITISICDTLVSLGYTEAGQRGLKEIGLLDRVAIPGSAQYWIVGMRHWLEYLLSRSHSHM